MRNDDSVYKIYYKEMSPAQLRECEVGDEIALFPIGSMGVGKYIRYANRFIAGKCTTYIVDVKIGLEYYKCVKVVVKRRHSMTRLTEEVYKVK